MGKPYAANQWGIPFKEAVRPRVFLTLCAAALIVPHLWAQGSSVSDLPSEPEANVQRFEIGLQYAFLGKGTCIPAYCFVPPEIALGPAFTWNVTPHLAIDAAYNFLATSESTPMVFYDGSFAGGRGASAVAGPRLEVRRAHYGFFLYAQLGAETWTRAPAEVILGENGVPISPPATGTRSFFSIAAGAGAEYSPTPLWHLRIGTGQRVVDYGRFVDASRCAECRQPATAWNSGADLTAGVYAGLGHSLRKRGPYQQEVHRHRFFDKTNNLLILGGTLASVGDGVTTQLFLDQGLPEGNPIERTFVQRGLGGDILLGAIAGSAAIGAMYGLHHMGHHWIERFLPAAILILGARNTYLNSKID